jgi:hypothetical protein
MDTRILRDGYYHPIQFRETTPEESSLHLNRRYNLQEWFSLEKLLDKNAERNQIGKRVKRRICRPEQTWLGGQPNGRFIPEAVARRMFASLTLSSCRLS